MVLKGLDCTSQAPAHHQHQLLLVIVIVVVKKRETFLPVRSPVSLHLIVNIQRNNTSIVLQVLAAAGSVKKGGKSLYLAGM